MRLIEYQVFATFLRAELNAQKSNALNTLRENMISRVTVLGFLPIVAK